MNYLQFRNQWLGKRVDYDGAYAYQCVDLIKQYVFQCYNLKPGSWGNAKDYWLSTNSALLTKFDKIANVSQTQMGDIVILKPTATNSYGHIAIADGTTYMLEQNGSTGNGSGTGNDAIRLRAIPYSRLYGVLRPKREDDDMLTPDEIKREYRVNRGTDPAQEEIDLHMRGGSFKALSYGFEYENAQRRAAYEKTITDLQTALLNEQKKPPKEIVKEVEKIVTEYVDRPVEVIKEVEKPLSWQRVIQWVREQLKRS